MPTRRIQLLTLAVFAMFGISVLIGGSQAHEPHSAFSPVIPKTWDEEALASLNVPLVDAGRTPLHASSDYYYRIPVRTIYKSYPIYAPDKEPPGYIEWLKQQEPEEIVIDFSKLATEQDWIRAGETVFNSPTFVGKTWVGADVRDPEMWTKTGMPVAKDGTIPFVSYVVRKKGEIEIGDGSCALCHTRVMPDRTVVKGAQGNLPGGSLTAFVGRKQAAEAKDPAVFLAAVRNSLRRAEAMPWLQPDPAESVGRMSLDQIISAYETMPPGVSGRNHSSLFFSPQLPDLIGIKERRYLDHTGFVRHRGIADLMRYAALVQGMDAFDLFGDFMFARSLPDPSTRQRYSDEQLYALALYVYSLKPPPNPKVFGVLAARGKQIFEREKCASCHTPPMYTNNKLTPVDGFTPPKDHFEKFSILPASVGTDTNSALRSRKGTGYYKVPSLRGVWYRGPFEHNGSVRTLEDWFDPQRLKENYVPAGLVGSGVKARPIVGHPFGLRLSEQDRRALIAFLKTL